MSNGRLGVPLFAVSSVFLEVLDLMSVVGALHREVAEAQIKGLVSSALACRVGPSTIPARSWNYTNYREAL
jgi:hypothetical protein